MLLDENLLHVSEPAPEVHFADVVTSDSSVCSKVGKHVLALVSIVVTDNERDNLNQIDNYEYRVATQ